jgi:hypothetical protein
METQRRIFTTFQPYLKIPSVTTDPYQGKENDVDLLPLVGNNRKGEIGFLIPARHSGVGVTPQLPVRRN